MNSLLLRLQGPLQSWGLQGRFSLRETQREPTKSGVVGILASASGFPRDYPVDEFALLRMGVRTDRPGKIIEDFHTISDSPTVSGNTLKHPVVTRRHYLADADFLVALEGPKKLLDQLLDTLDHPTWPLFLGRKSCPPGSKVGIAVVDRPIEQALEEYPWFARNPRELRRSPSTLSYTIETAPGDSLDVRMDVPLSFYPLDRQYAARTVRTFKLPLPKNRVEKDSLCFSQS